MRVRQQRSLINVLENWEKETKKNPKQKQNQKIPVNKKGKK